MVFLGARSFSSVYKIAWDLQKKLLGPKIKKESGKIEINEYIKITYKLCCSVNIANW